MYRLPFVLAFLAAISCGHAAAQDGTGRLAVGLTILEPVSTDRGGPATVRRVGPALDVSLPASAGVEPIVAVTVERDGEVTACAPRRRGGDAPSGAGVYRTSCPVPERLAHGAVRIRMVIVPVS